MQRWMLTSALAAATGLAALLVPNLGATHASPAPPSPDPVVPDVAVPSGFGPLSLSATLDQTALMQGSGDDRYLVIEINAPEVAGDIRRPVHMSVVVDTSGSMAGKGKMDNARIAAAELVQQLGPQDTFSLVTFDDSARVVVPQSAVTDPSGLTRRVRQMRPEGGTNIYDGLQAGIAQLSQTSPDAVRRVVLLSDGKATVGIRDADSLRALAGSQARSGISVSAMGLGLDYNEDLLAAMSDAGGGNYRFIDRPGALAEMFQQELKQMSAVVSRESLVRVDLPEGVRLLELYGYDGAVTMDGYEVYLGDVHGGEKRKIVARVSVEDRAVGSVDVANVRLSYTQADSGDPGRAFANVNATVTPDRAVARASMDKDAGTKATRARSATLMDSAARDYERGDLAGNQKKMTEAAGLLSALGYVYDDMDLMRESEEVKQRQVNFAAAPMGSDEALYQVKSTKGEARVSSR